MSLLIVPVAHAVILLLYFQEVVRFETTSRERACLLKRLMRYRQTRRGPALLGRRWFRCGASPRRIGWAKSTCKPCGRSTSTSMAASSSSCSDLQEVENRPQFDGTGKCRFGYRYCRSSNAPGRSPRTGQVGTWHDDCRDYPQCWYRRDGGSRHHDAQRPDRRRATEYDQTGPVSIDVVCQLRCSDVRIVPRSLFPCHACVP